LVFCPIESIAVEILEIDHVIFAIGLFELRWYGIMVARGVSR